VGDSLKADYRGGANAGLQSILIDRAKEADVARKMVSLTDLTTILST
jgi:FMN phosphatase YigB (HAD superfamily)